MSLSVNMWVITAALALVVVIYWYVIKPYGYWKKKGIPHPRPRYLLGNLGDSLVQKRNLGQIYGDIYNAYKNYLYVGYYKFLTPGIIVRDMELVKNVLIKDFASFHDNDLELDEDVDPLFGRNPFCLRGHKWKIVRSLITSGITSGKVKNMLTLITSVCKDLVDHIENETSTMGNDGLNAKEMAAKYTTDVVATCAFGLEAKSLKDPKSKFREMGQLFMNPSFLVSLKHTAIFVIPALTKKLRIKFVPTVVRDWFTAIVTKTIKYRQDNNVVRNDYLDLLISLKNKSTEYEFKDIDIVAQAMTFYGDGFETSSIALSFTLYELANNQDIQRRLRTEIDTVLDKYNGEITYDGMQEMSYLDNVLSEVLRMHSPVLFMVKVCTKKYELPPPKGAGTGPNLILEPGTPIAIPIMAIHYDPKYYPNPYVFDPERFTEENKNARPKCSYLPFSEGPRICLGMRFGLTQTKAGIIAILSNFEVKMNRRTVRPLEQDPSYLLASSKSVIWLNFIKRRK